MGRTALFDRTTVVRVARDVFWSSGFDETSIADLEGATGVNRSSLYHCFGSKRGLFDAAVDDYLEAVIRPRLRVLRAPAPPGGALLQYLEALRATVAALPDDSARRGCLLVNCAAGLAGHDADARDVVAAYWSELRAALREALTAGLPRPTDPAAVDERARVLAALTTTAMLLARVGPTEPLAMLDTATALVREWIDLPLSGTLRPGGPAGQTGN
ncbi:MAG: TetR/AcrR family transcriptional regulator [Cellulomonas sp.]